MYYVSLYIFYISKVSPFHFVNPTLLLFAFFLLFSSQNIFLLFFYFFTLSHFSALSNKLNQSLLSFSFIRPLKSILFPKSFFLRLSEEKKIMFRILLRIWEKETYYKKFHLSSFFSFNQVEWREKRAAFACSSIPYTCFPLSLSFLAVSFLMDVIIYQHSRFPSIKCYLQYQYPT